MPFRSVPIIRHYVSKDSGLCRSVVSLDLAKGPLLRKRNRKDASSVRTSRVQTSATRSVGLGGTNNIPLAAYGTTLTVVGLAALSSISIQVCDSVL